MVADADLAVKDGIRRAMIRAMSLAAAVPSEIIAIRAGSITSKDALSMMVPPWGSATVMASAVRGPVRRTGSSLSSILSGDQASGAKCWTT